MFINGRAFCTRRAGLYAVLSLSAACVSGCAGTSAAAPQSTYQAPQAGDQASDPASGSPLELVGVGNTGSFNDSAFGSCRIGDALAVVANRTRGAIRIEAVKVKAPSTSSRVESESLQVAQITAAQAGGGFSGLVGSFDYAFLRGIAIRDAVGAELAPATSVGPDYVLIVGLKIAAPAHAAVSITAITVYFTAAGQSDSVTLPQHVELQTAGACAG